MILHYVQGWTAARRSLCGLVGMIREKLSTSEKNHPLEAGLRRVCIVLKAGGSTSETNRSRHAVWPPTLCAMVLSHTDKYERFEQRNNLEKQVQDAKMERSEADKLIKTILAREVQQREALERKIKAQAAEHR